MEYTKLVAANTAKSLRATVPMSIVKQLGLEEGQQLGWKLDKDDKGWFVEVRGAEQTGDEV